MLHSSHDRILKGAEGGEYGHLDKFILCNVNFDCKIATDFQFQ